MQTLARAPVGCTTTLVFDKAGKFTRLHRDKGKSATSAATATPAAPSTTDDGDSAPTVR